MKTYYLDGDYRLHLQQDIDNSRLPWEDEGGFFTGKCDVFVAGYRVVPQGHTWVSKKGVAFQGLMMGPAVSLEILEAAQSAYEQARDEATQRMDEIEEAMCELAELLVEG